MTTNPVSLPQNTAEPRVASRSLGRFDHPRLALLVLLGAVLLGAASLVYLNLAATVATSSTRLQEMSKERRVLEWQRVEKASELAQLTNPERLEKRATELGYRAPRAFTYVTVSPDVLGALDSKAAATTRTTTADIPPSTGWDGIRQQFERWLAR